MAQTARSVANLSPEGISEFGSSTSGCASLFLASPKTPSWRFSHSLSDLVMPVAHQSQIFVSSSDFSLLCVRPLDISP